MAKILLLDFNEADRDHLVSENYDVTLESTAWASGKEKALEIPGETEVVFYKIAAYDPAGRSSLHEGAQAKIERLVDGGVRVVCFIGGGEIHQLTNITGAFGGLQFLDGTRSESIVFNPRALFHVPFERYRPYLSKVYKLAQEALGDGVWEKEFPGGTFEVLAKSADGYPVSVLIKKGKGYYLLLPSFGAKDTEIAEYLLKDKLSFAAETSRPEELDWIDHEDYVFPDLRVLLDKKGEERLRHEQALAEIDRQIREMKASGEEAFHDLLRAEGPPLKKAVLHALEYLGWGRVVDVDEYWKKVIRNKEEDVWLIESTGPSVEVSLRKEDLILILVRGNKNWATDDECSLLQKFKGRRMQEFDNTKMKAVLIGNYFSATDPKARGNPFSAVQVDEALKDGNGLLTTYELFRAVKAEKEKRITKSSVRAQIREKGGLITLE